MKEIIVNPFIARITKIKGFEWETKSFYNDKDKLCQCSDKYCYCSNKLTKENSFSYNANGDDKFIMSAPTLSHLQKWIRYKYKTDIVIVPTQPSIYICNIYVQIENHIDVTSLKEDRKQVTFKSYEEALEAGLLFCLKQH